MLISRNMWCDMCERRDGADSAHIRAVSPILPLILSVRFIRDNVVT